MDSKTMTRLAAILIATLLASATRSSSAADPPSPAQALSLKPMQPFVEYSIPNNEEAAQCTVKLEKDNKVSNWVVANRQGEVLRRFYDTNGDNYVDMWCYFLNGVEVYRDIDSNYNNKADQYRWLNTAGTRWAVDKNEDGKIDSWKVISPPCPSSRRVRSIDSTGVMPLPPLMSRILSGLRAGIRNTPSACDRLSTSPGWALACRYCDTRPCGCALTVSSMRPSARCCEHAGE